MLADLSNHHHIFPEYHSGCWYFPTLLLSRTAGMTDKARSSFGQNNILVISMPLSKYSACDESLLIVIILY